MKKLSFLLILLFFISGCVYQKKTLTEMEYNQYAAIHLFLDKCHENEYIDTNNAALGMMYLNSTLSRYAYNKSALDEKYNAFKKEFENELIPQSELKDQCKKIELGIVQVKIEKDMNYKNNETRTYYNQAKPTTTYCNKIGFQTICNSY